METSTYKADGIYAKELEDELMKYTKYDHKVETNLDEKSQKTDEAQTYGDVEVNITECTRSVGHDLVAAEYQNTTESSSSFGDSNCGAENVDTLDDSEVSSDFRGDSASAPNNNEFGERFRMRKKKLTTHWRAFIQPLMWRCKWVELQIMKLQSQAQQYDRELEAYNKKKETQLDNSTMVDGVKSHPFLRENAKSDVFKRKKRRRTEATVDITSYMSQHNLFSCYENRKCLTEGASMNTESKNPATQKIGIDDEIWGNEELLSFDPGNGDDTLEYMLWKIDHLQSQVRCMKSKVDTIKRENAERLSFAASLNLPPPDNENAMEGTYISSQTMSALPQIAATSHGDLLIGNGGIGHACFGAHKRVEDGVLIDNQKVKEEIDNFEEVKIHPIQKPMELKDGSDGTTTADVAEPDLPEDQPPLKIRSISKLTPPKGKRKRGRKRGAVGRWSRRATGGRRAFWVNCL